MGGLRLEPELVDELDAEAKEQGFTNRTALLNPQRATGFIV